MPVGWLSLSLKRSPLIPTVVACAEISFSIWVTRARPPTMVPRASAGASAYRPFALPGRGAVITWKATAPCGVNCTPCSYVIRGINSTLVAPGATAGSRPAPCAVAAKAPASSKNVTVRRTMTAAESSRTGRRRSAPFTGSVQRYDPPVRRALGVLVLFVGVAAPAWAHGGATDEAVEGLKTAPVYVEPGAAPT